jgi:hypothetical protein
MSNQLRCIVLIIRVTANLTLVLIWIICCPYQNIGRGLIIYVLTMYYWCQYMY